MKKSYSHVFISGLLCICLQQQIKAQSHKFEKKVESEPKTKVFEPTKEVETPPTEEPKIATETHEQKAIETKEVPVKISDPEKTKDARIFNDPNFKPMPKQIKRGAVLPNTIASPKTN